MNRRIRITHHATVDMEDRDAEARNKAYDDGWTDGNDNANREAIIERQLRFEKTLRQRNNLADLATHALSLLLLAARDRQWEPNQFVQSGDLLLTNNALWKCTKAGKTGSTQPKWKQSLLMTSRGGRLQRPRPNHGTGYILHDRDARWMLCHHDLEILVNRLSDEESDTLTTLLESINGDQVDEHPTPQSADTVRIDISSPPTVQSLQRFGEAIEDAQANIANAFQVPRRTLNHDED